ncbi:putative membrane protein [Bacteroides fragilis str. 1007-1-F |nr:putative membrane protein [Bacteroides fragilis str. 1007-1-F \
MEIYNSPTVSILFMLLHFMIKIQFSLCTLKYYIHICSAK